MKFARLSRFSRLAPLGRSFKRCSVVKLSSRTPICVGGCIPVAFLSRNRLFFAVAKHESEMYKRAPFLWNRIFFLYRSKVQLRYYLMLSWPLGYFHTYRIRRPEKSIATYNEKDEIFRQGAFWNNQNTNTWVLFWLIYHRILFILRILNETTVKQSRSDNIWPTKRVIVELRFKSNIFLLSIIANNTKVPVSSLMVESGHTINRARAIVL